MAVLQAPSLWRRQLRPSNCLPWLLHLARNQAVLRHCAAWRQLLLHSQKVAHGMAPAAAFRHHRKAPTPLPLHRRRHLRLLHVLGSLPPLLKPSWRQPCKTPAGQKKWLLFKQRWPVLVWEAAVQEQRRH